MNTVDGVIASTGTSLPDFEDTSCLLCASDYSGQHKSALFETYAFLIVDMESWRDWETVRLQLRSQELHNRTMSFKGLNDKIKRRALPKFLESAETLHGVLATIAVEKRIGSLFSRTMKFDFADLTEFQYYGAETFERLMRTVHFLGLFLAGLSYPRQDLFWFGDADAIAANSNRVRTLTDLFGKVTSHYLPHDLGHLRCGTSSLCDNGTMQIEDLCSLADLSAGAVSELLNSYMLKGSTPSSKLIVPTPEDTTRKARYIGGWLAQSGPRLARLTISFEAEPDSGKIVVKRLKFHEPRNGITIGCG